MAYKPVTPAPMTMASTCSIESSLMADVWYGELVMMVFLYLSNSNDNLKLYD